MVVPRLVLQRSLPLLLRHVPLRVSFLISRRSYCSATAAADNSTNTLKEDPPPLNPPIWDNHEDDKWKDQILQDLEPITTLAKQILHSNRYKDGERLTVEDEKVVTDKILAHHPHLEDKIGCGLDSIMVDLHPHFNNTRCLFVVRTDGEVVDFSYHKCLRAYIQDKYPSHAERFLQEHYNRRRS